MTLWFSIIVYQDAPSLRSCLESVRGFTSAPVAVVDGRYRSFPSLGDDGSTDGAEALATEFGAVFIPAWPGGWPTQFVKRTAQLSCAREGDWVSCLDADERIEGDATALLDRLAKTKATECSLEIHGTGRYAGGRVWRLFKMGRDLHLFGAHFIHWRGTRLLRRREAEFLPSSVVRIIHRPEEDRSKGRIRAKHEFYQRRAQHDEWRRPIYERIVVG